MCQKVKGFEKIAYLILIVNSNVFGESGDIRRILEMTGKMASRFGEGYRKSDGHLGDKMIEGLIESSTPDANEATRKIQRDAVKFLIDPDQERSKDHLGRMVNNTKKLVGRSSSGYRTCLPEKDYQRPIEDYGFTVDRFGISNGAHLFNGANHYLDTGIISIPSKALSIEGWYKTESRKKDMILIGNDGENRLQVALNQGRSGVFRVYVKINNRPSLDARVSVGMKAIDGNWHHIAIVAELAKGSVEFFFDGEKLPVDLRVSRRATMNRFTYPLYLGANNRGMTPSKSRGEMVSNFYQGALDEISITNKKISSDGRAVTHKGKNLESNIKVQLRFLKELFEEKLISRRVYEARQETILSLIK